MRNITFQPALAALQRGDGMVALGHMKAADSVVLGQLGDADSGSTGSAVKGVLIGLTLVGIFIGSLLWLEESQSSLAKRYRKSRVRPGRAT